MSPAVPSHASSELPPEAVTSASVGSPANDPSAPTPETSGASTFDNVQSTLPISFNFNWNEQLVAVRLFEIEDQTFIRLMTDLGSIPYTAENPPRRDRLLTLCHAGVELPQGGFSRTVHQRVIYWVEAPIERPLTGDRIVATCTSLLLQAKPYFVMMN